MNPSSSESASRIIASTSSSETIWPRFERIDVRSSADILLSLLCHINLSRIKVRATDFNRDVKTQLRTKISFRAMVTGAPLEDTCHLAQRYSRMRQEAEVQVTEVSRRQQRVREASTQKNVGKLRATEAKLQEVKANIAVLGKRSISSTSCC